MADRCARRFLWLRCHRLNLNPWPASRRRPHRLQIGAWQIRRVRPSDKYRMVEAETLAYQIRGDIQKGGKIANCGNLANHLRHHLKLKCAAIEILCVSRDASLEGVNSASSRAVILLTARDNFPISSVVDELMLSRLLLFNSVTAVVRSLIGRNARVMIRYAPRPPSAMTSRPVSPPVISPLFCWVVRSVRSMTTSKTPILFRSNPGLVSRVRRKSGHWNSYSKCCPCLPEHSDKHQDHCIPASHARMRQ